MHDRVRQEIATTAKTIVIKVGTRVLTSADGTLNHERIAILGGELHKIMASGRKVALVSSGAVGAGMSRLELKQRPTDLAKLQAVAAIGQSALIEAYDQTLRHLGCHVAQVLLTADGLDQRASYLNVRNTILSLLEFGAIPVINENDTVSVDELLTTFGDNDRLAALVTNLIGAPLLIILSDVDGLYDGDPDNGKSQLLSTVTRVDESICALARDRVSGVSQGGMTSKLEAAQLVTRAGENVIIASGHKVGVLDRILAGELEGTLFLAQGKTISPWKRWIGLAVQPRGQLELDAGACRAIAQEGCSLLAIGIISARGDFSKGEVVSLIDEHGTEFSRGLTNYARRDIDRIQGKRSEQIPQILGHLPYEEVIHRDNMVVLDNV